MTTDQHAGHGGTKESSESTSSRLAIVPLVASVRNSTKSNAAPLDPGGNGGDGSDGSGCHVDNRFTGDDNALTTAPSNEPSNVVRFSRLKNPAALSLSELNLGKKCISVANPCHNISL